MAKKIEDLSIHSKVEAFWSAINAILDNPAVRKDSDLHDEISRANESIPSNMVDGFEQGTDQELNARIAQGEELEKMLGGFIKYLQASDFKDRGHHRASENRTTKTSKS